MDSLVSIIVPVYNAETSLKKCIDSILNQTYDNVEVILIDDGSTDKSYEICRQYLKNCRVKYVYQHNQGVSFSRNHGIELATGEYIMFVDSDDFLKEECVLNLLSDMLKNNADFAFSGIETHYMKSDVVEMKKSVVPVGGFYEIKDFLINFERFRLFLNSPWKCLYKKQIILDNELRFPLNVHLGEDKIFVSEYLVYCKKICAVDKADYVYVIKEAGTLSSKTNLTAPLYNFKSAVYRNKMYSINGIDIGDKEHCRQFYDTLIFNFMRVFSRRLSNNIADKKKYCFTIMNDIETRQLLKKYKGYSLRTKLLRFLLLYKMKNCLYLMWAIQQRW